MRNPDAAARLRDGPRLDPAEPAFWDVRYREAVTPWDAGGVPAALTAALPALGRERRVLIPGCGAGYEVAAFVRAGHEVLAIDFSQAAVDAARVVLAPLGERVVACVQQGDFFSFDADQGFDLVYERAFLCALPRRRWPAYAARMAAVLRPGGALAGFFFFGDGERGPPFTLHMGEIEALLGSAFECVEDAAVAESIAVFAGRERWQSWRRR